MAYASVTDLIDDLLEVSDEEIVMLPIKDFWFKSGLNVTRAGREPMTVLPSISHAATRQELEEMKRSGVTAIQRGCDNDGSFRSLYYELDGAAWRETDYFPYNGVPYQLKHGRDENGSYSIKLDSRPLLLRLDASALIAAGP